MHLFHISQGGAATPVNWQPGGECMVVPSVKADEAAKLFPQHRVVDVSELYSLSSL